MVRPSSTLSPYKNPTNGTPCDIPEVDDARCLRTVRMIRLGIVDFDSSHAVEFTRRMNHVGLDADQFVDGARVVLGYPGESTMSPERIAEFTSQIESCGANIVNNPEQMMGEIDAILVLSLCGDAHLNRVRPFLQAGLPAYVDKPFACSTGDAREMIRLSADHNAPLFSASALRFSAETLRFQQQSDSRGPVLGAISYGPGKRAVGNPGLFHYGIHAVELLLAVMGPGCTEVTNIYSPEAETVTGRWADGRMGTVRCGRQGAMRYGLTAFCEGGVVPIDVSTRYAYRNLCREIIGSFQSGRPPVTNEEMLQTVAFIEAALASENSGGHPVPLTA